MAKPAGVHGQGDEEGIGGRRRQRHAESCNCLEHHAAGSLGGGVYQPQGPELVLRLMVVDDQFDGHEGAEERPECAELVTRARIEHHDDLGLAPELARRRELLNAGIGVEKAIAGRKGAGDDHLDFLALLPQHLFESQH